MWQRGWRMLVLGASLAAAACGAWASENPDNETVIMAGNVVTGEGCDDLIDAGRARPIDGAALPANGTAKMEPGR